MSTREQLATSRDNIVSASDALRAASGDLARAFHFQPSAGWYRPANANVRPARLQPVLKRALDLTLAIPALILLAPVLALIGLFVRLDSMGPIFFRQTRLGLNGRPFDIYKFRTMTVLENGGTIVQACRNDARITRIGGWLRASSLDELPQLLNVISGEMSLVGPRPHARAHDRYYAAEISGYEIRQSVKPGITGWAQIHGLRGETPTLDSMRARVDCDIWYVRNASFATDLEVLLRTPIEILRCRNAH